MREPVRPIRRRVLFGAMSALLACVLSVLSLEVGLWLLAPYLPANISTAMFTRYTMEPDGMYVYDVPTGYRIMRPNDELRAFWAGRGWAHRTDAWGFRNPPGIAKQILLLGDSMVYGHGVDEPESFAGLLRSRYEHPVYNMARQGDCIYENYISVKAWAPDFRPRTVVLFVFINDLQDALLHGATPAPPAFPHAPHIAALRNRVVALRNGTSGPTLSQRFHMSNSFRLYNVLKNRWRFADQFQLFPAGTDAPPPYYIDAVMRDDLYRLASGYYRYLTRDLAAYVQSQGAELQLIDLDTRGALPRFAAASDRMRALVRQLCIENQLACYSTRHVLESCPNCFLPHDGHLNGEGNRRVAEFLDTVFAGRAERLVQVARSGTARQ